jgi:hypothetical protein
MVVQTIWQLRALHCNSCFVAHYIKTTGFVSETLSLLQNYFNVTKKRSSLLKGLHEFLHKDIQHNNKKMRHSA